MQHSVYLKMKNGLCIKKKIDWRDVNYFIFLEISNIK